MSFCKIDSSGVCCIENVKCDFLANNYGTPLYVYSKNDILKNFDSYNNSAEGIDHLICYAVKANSNIAILQILSEKGAGFDIVSKGELARVIQAGGDPKKVVYSGVAKRVDEIEYALDKEILCFNVESESELYRINEVAKKKGVKAPISIRVNPDVDAGTHPYISTGLKSNKFGITVDKAYELYVACNNLENIEIKGIDCHIGSQLTSLAPFADALDRLLILIKKLENIGIKLHHIDVGGGLGVDYKDEIPPTPCEYMNVIKDKLKDLKLKLICEPGRSMVANAGYLITKVEYIKEGETTNFCIVDAAMNDMIRPSLYSAWMNIETVYKNSEEPKKIYNIVGPICETGDFLGKERELSVKEGEYLIQSGAGAYGFSMSSNYNSRPRAAEVMVDNDNVTVIRDRETIEQLWQGEHRV
ncbi:MAG: diaminopimelate decarboxylase [Succinivibrionaceae bacterium]